MLLCGVPPSSKLCCWLCTLLEDTSLAAFRVRFHSCRRGAFSSFSPSLSFFVSPPSHHPLLNFLFLVTISYTERKQTNELLGLQAEAASPTPSSLDPQSAAPLPHPTGTAEPWATGGLHLCGAPTAELEVRRGQHCWGRGVQPRAWHQGLGICKADVQTRLCFVLLAQGFSWEHGSYWDFFLRRQRK